jgi:multicomponent K+:H+ antiporter subunit A
MSSLLWAAVLVPAGLGLLLLLRRPGGWFRGALALAGAATTLALIVLLWLRQGSAAATYTGLAPAVAAPLFVVDRIGLLLAALFGFIWLLVALYSLGYMKGQLLQDDYYGFLMLMLGAMTAFCFSWNLIAIYMFWEFAGICTWRLVAFRRGEFEVGIANRTLLLTFFGSVLMLVGFAAIFVERSSFDLRALSGVAINPWVAGLILLGMVTKSASLPLYIWLPDAHTAAPSPVSALLSGIVAKIGLIAYVRVFIQSGVVLPAWWTWLVAGLGVIGALVAAGCALRENDTKRLLAFSTVSQLGYIFIGFALVSGFGVVAGLIYLVAHALAKSGLFLAMGLVEHSTGRRDIRELGGLARSMPVTAVCVALLMLSVVGVPPMLGFFGKFYVIVAALGASPLVAIGAVVAAVLTLLYMLRLFGMFTGPAREGVAGHESGTMTVAVAVLALASIGLGFVFPALLKLFERGLSL